MSLSNNYQNFVWNTNKNQNIGLVRKVAVVWTKQNSDKYGENFVLYNFFWSSLCLYTSFGLNQLSLLLSQQRQLTHHQRQHKAHFQKNSFVFHCFATKKRIIIRAQHHLSHDKLPNQPQHNITKARVVLPFVCDRDLSATNHVVLRLLLLGGEPPHEHLLPLQGLA